MESISPSKKITTSFREIYTNFRNCHGQLIIIAHRGNWNRAPENSLRAIQLAIAAKADMVELDVRRTRDGALILMHDESIDRMTTGSGNIDELSLEEIRSFRLLNRQGEDTLAITNEKVPTLEEAMLLARNKIMVNLDKCWEFRDEVYAVLEKTDTVNHGLFKSFANIDEVEAFLKGKRVRPEYMHIIQPSNQHVLVQMESIIDRIRPEAIELIFHDDNSAISSVSTIRNLNQSTRIWMNAMWGTLCGGKSDETANANKQTGWEWLLQRGANMLQTDHPEELRAFIRNNKG